MSKHRTSLKAAAMAGAGVAALLSAAPAAYAQEQVTSFNIAEGPLSRSLLELGRQARISVAAPRDITAGRTGKSVQGELTTRDALVALLDGSGLTYDFVSPTAVRVDAPQGASASDGADGTVEALIVTAQKREEDIQDVPIAISAFTQEQLENSQVAGGPDLMTQVPNMTFTKTNFSSYSIQIRGIGTQAISATTDPAVAVAFNNTPFIRNHFFEQEFYDLQRIEVLRGPQGTLYGRNATAGVVNVISSKPAFRFEAKLGGDIANYHTTRLEGMVNIPIVEDMVALRLAGAWTKREGYATNEITGNPIDGRDLWSSRVSLRFAPTDTIDVNLIWEHFEEDDDRIRSGKQLCKTHEISEFAGFPTTHFQTLPEYGQGLLFAGVQGSFSQGCEPSSLYSPDSFETPNGIVLPYYLPLSALQLPIALEDPYVSRFQSHDLRVIESAVDPEYRAKADIVELQASFDIGDSLNLTSETAWMSDFLFSTQDYNRFNTAAGAWDPDTQAFWQQTGILDENGIFCDPQIGCSDRLVATDLITDRSTQFSQEFRLASDFDGPFNFSLGANYTRHDALVKYYVFINSLTMYAASRNFVIGSHPGWEPGVTTNSDCLKFGPVPPSYAGIEQVGGCQYIDPNPIDNLNDLGHNYFLSKNPYKLISYAVFGEAYYNVTDNLKVTAGLRWTVDKKEAPRVPSWILASYTVGYPVAEVVEQEWREPTGRLTVDWKPDLAFTDETLVYGSYAHGYKAGGANPPAAGAVVYTASIDERRRLLAESAVKPRTFDPEFIDAFEIGAKNTLLDGRVTLNLAAFYYDYKDYQISYIADRSAINLNFDAEIWGLEIEADWRPLENLRLGFKGGYENTRVGDGERAIDVMDRTAGNDAWTTYRPFPTFANNCVLPKWLFIGNTSSPGNPELVNVGGRGGGGAGGCELAYLSGRDPATGEEYAFDPFNTLPGLPINLRNNVNYADWSTDLADYPGWPTGVPIANGMDYPGWDPTLDYGNNHGEGFFKDLSGNELPNAPHFTATITADYTVPLPSDWLVTLHTDLYYQSEAWTRIFNTPGYDKLKAYTNVNFAAIFTNEDAGWKVMAFVKNVFDRDSITGAFLNSDDSGLTTNVFLTEPRLYGLRITKEWTGGPLLGGFGARHEGPYPFNVEVGGMVQRQDALNETFLPSFADAFEDEIEPFSDQETDLDWGDGREVKLLYNARNGWTASAGVRWGKTNGGERNIRLSEDSEKACVLEAAFLCRYYLGGAPESYVYVQDTSNAESIDREEHTLIDFTVGRDVGLGFGASAISAGLRYAQFKSSTAVDMYGDPDWQAELVGSGYYAKYRLYRHRYTARFEAEREFKGAGPVLTWEMAAPLLGSDDTGHLTLDGAVSGGVLFGKQKTNISGEEIATYYRHSGYAFGSITALDGPDTTQLDIAPRSKSVTAPVLGANLGLSYKVDRFSVGAGYRWERYYDVIDGGVAEARKVDRTIDGPYFKLSVGFGG